MDTGAGDSTTLPVIAYELQVDENFGQGFKAITSIEDSQYVSLVFNHTSLIRGHKYTYRVRAANLMGYGEFSSQFQYTPRSAPMRPLSGPRNSGTTQTKLSIEFDRIMEDGGEEILNYHVYVDDGLDGPFTKYLVSEEFKWNSDGVINDLQTGNYYRIMYSSTNIHAESQLSDETIILLAETPSMPHSLARIDEKTLPAG